MSSPLDKTAARAKARRERARENGSSFVKPLDPPFPFVVIEFEPDFFGVSANPPESISENSK